MKRLLRLPEVMHTVGLSRSEIYRLERAGKFPRRVPLTEKTSGWASDELEAWIERRVAEREAKAAERVSVGLRLCAARQPARAA